MRLNVTLLRTLSNLCIEKIQGIPIYRRIARLSLSGVEIKEPDEGELKKVRAWLNPGGSEVPVPQKLHVINLVAKKGNRVIGFVQLVRRPEGDHPYAGHWLFGLVVRKRHRGMGMGERLSRAVIERAKEEGAEEISLLVYEDNCPAIELYRKLGFRMKVVPALEPQLEKERLSFGRRRVVMSKPLVAEMVLDHHR